jgi:Fe2+ or Zn2+ uptake regulation protein
MRDANGKKIIFFCEVCGRVKPFEEWLVMKAEEQMALAKQNLSFVKTVCPTCERRK